MFIKKYIVSMNPTLLILFVISWILIIVIEFWLIDIPEFFSSGYEVGQIIYTLSISFIASFFFYFILVHFKECNEREGLNTYLIDKVERLVLLTIQSLSNMSKSCGLIELTELPHKSIIEDIFSKICPTSDSTMVFAYSPKNHLSWLGYLSEYKLRTMNIIGNLNNKSHFLEPAFILLISKLEECIHFAVIEKLSLTMMDNEDMLNFTDAFSEYIEIIREIKTYVEKLK